MQSFWESSSDPGKVSLTIKGFAALVIPIGGLILNHYGHTLDQGWVNSVEDAITNVIVLGSSLVSGVMILWGLLRKFYHA